MPSSLLQIYRKKRCYSLVDKEQEGRGSSQWKTGHVIPQRDNNARIQSNSSSGPSSFKPTQRNDFMRSNNYGNHSVSPPDRESVRNYRQHSKRPNDRLGFNSVSGPEFDVPVVKKQMVENYKSPPLRHNISPERGRDKQKLVLDDTKWMYKNQHAKMSGPYGVNQLMEGFYARFLQEDLPVYQFQDGTLGRPIMLKQLIDDLESCSSRMHNPARHCDESLCEKGFCPIASPPEMVEDLDLPPGFGGCSAQLSDRPSSIHRHKSTASAAPKHSVGALSSLSPDFGAVEFDLPPGFEAVACTASPVEPYVRELQGSSRKLSKSAGVAVWSEGVEGMQSSYEEFQPVVHDRGHLNHQGNLPLSKVNFSMQGAKSWSDNSMQPESIVHSQGYFSQQDSSPPSKANLTLQGARSLSENSSRHTTWASTSPSTRVLNIEAQTFPSPTVCIGLPVSKPAMQKWPVGNSLPLAYAQTANNGLSESSVMLGITPLDLIYSELLTAVKRSYVKTVLSALIDEQLNCWIHGRDIMVKLLLPEDGSRCREASSLSSAEFCVVGVESHTPQNGASPSLVKQHIGSEETSLQVQAVQSSDGSCLDAHNRSAEILLEPRVAQCFDGSGLNDQFIHFEEEQCLSVGATSVRNGGNTCTAFAMKGLGEADSVLSCDEASTLSVKSSGDIVDNLKQVVVGQRVEMQHLTRDKILEEEGPSAGKIQSSGCTSDGVYLQTEPSFLVYGRKKWKTKSLKCIMQITSLPRPRDTKISSSSISKKEEISMGMLPETSLQNGVLISEDCDGCARTSSDGWLWRKLARHAPHSQNLLKENRKFYTRFDTPTQMHPTELQKFSAAADGSFIFKPTQSEAKLKLARSKIHEWGIFAIEPVEAGDLVIEYVGEIVRSKVSDIREQQYKNSGVGCGFLFRVDDEMVVDATKQGGFARFMNYSCDPNCYSKIVTLKGSKKVYIYAKRRILSGEELTYDCKFALEDQKIPCNCGSARCRDSAHK